MEGDESEAYDVIEGVESIGAQIPSIAENGTEGFSSGQENLNKPQRKKRHERKRRVREDRNGEALPKNLLSKEVDLEPSTEKPEEAGFFGRGKWKEKCGATPSMSKAEKPVKKNYSRNKKLDMTWNQSCSSMVADGHSSRENFQMENDEASVRVQAYFEAAAEALPEPFLGHLETPNNWDYGRPLNYKKRRNRKRRGAADKKISVQASEEEHADQLRTVENIVLFDDRKQNINLQKESAELKETEEEEQEADVVSLPDSPNSEGKDIGRFFHNEEFDFASGVWTDAGASVAAGSTDADRNISNVQPTFKEANIAVGDLNTSRNAEERVVKGEVQRRCAGEVRQTADSAAPAVEKPRINKPLTIAKDIFDGFTPKFNKAIFLQNGRVEVTLQKGNNKDYILICFFECDGGNKPNRVTRGTYKVFSCVVVSADADKQHLMTALNEGAKHLEIVSSNLFSQAEKPPAYEISECSLPYLAKHFVTPLKETDSKPERFERAIYYCSICYNHFFSVDHAVTHCDAREHIDAEKDYAAMQRLNLLPPPSEAQIASISELLERELAHAQLGRDAYVNAGTFIEKLSNILHKSVHEECSLVLFGSYFVGNATPRSNVNLSLVHPPSLQKTTVLFRLLSILTSEQANEASGISEVAKDFRSSAPSIRISVAAGKIHAEPVTVVISTQCSRSVLTSRYIALFTRIRSQFIELSTLFRYWAEICSLDDLAIGGLPKFAFDVMLIHYLQMKGYLPFPFEMVGEPNEVAEGGEGSEESEEKKIPSYQEDVAEILRVFGEDEKSWNLGAIWTDLFRYYALERSNGHLVQVRWKVPEEKTEHKRYNKKYIGIEDPISPERICQPSSSFSGYLNSCFLCTFLHFSIPRTPEGPLIPYILRNNEQTSGKKGKKKTSKEETAPEKPKNDNADAPLKADLPPVEVLGPLTTEIPKPEETVQDMPFTGCLEPTEVAFTAEENEHLREAEGSLSSESEAKYADDVVLSPLWERSSPVENSFEDWLPSLFPDEDGDITGAIDQSVLEKVASSHFPTGDAKQDVVECASNEIRKTYSRSALLRLPRSANPDTENQVEEISAILAEMLATLEATTSVSYTPSEGHQTDATSLEIEDSACELAHSDLDKPLEHINYGGDLFRAYSLAPNDLFTESPPCLNEQPDYCELLTSPPEERGCFELDCDAAWQLENGTLKDVHSGDFMMEATERVVPKVQPEVFPLRRCEEDAVVEVDVSRRIYSRNFMLERSKFPDHRIINATVLKEIGLLKEPVYSSASQIYRGVRSVDTSPVKKAKGAGKARNVLHASRFHLEIPEFNMGAVCARWGKLKKDDFAYIWDRKSFTNDAKPEIRCNSCGNAGHLSKGCPELEVPEPKDLAPLSDVQAKFLGVVVYYFFNQLRIQAENEKMMENLRADLEKTLRINYRPDCRLSLFGSASNGFGLVRSDADICLRFGSNENSPEEDPAMVVLKISNIVKRMTGVKSVKPIVSAKVPITKIEFDERYDRLEADVSLYNVLALENTRLLRSYCILDERVRQLGVALKHWAGCCEIRDASRGSLSSYSYTVMLIHYLQRTTPPVLPFLQQISPPGEEKTANMVDGYDVYFCDAEKSGWKSENKEKVGALWFGFFDYFAREFDFEDQVIQIRQEKPLWKLDKGWQTRPIAIEDPFELKHNLSSGVHSKTLTYIRKSFVRSRQRFGTVVTPTAYLNERDVAQLARSLFNKCRVEGGPPMDRNCCFRCHGVGHFADSCPNLLCGYKKAKNESGFNGGLKRGKRNGPSSDSRGRGGYSFTGTRTNGLSVMENRNLFDQWGRSPSHSSPQGDTEAWKKRNANNHMYAMNYGRHNPQDFRGRVYGQGKPSNDMVSTSGGERSNGRNGRPRAQGTGSGKGKLP